MCYTELELELEFPPHTFCKFLERLYSPRPRPTPPQKPTMDFRIAGPPRPATVIPSATVAPIARPVPVEYTILEIPCLTVIVGRCSGGRRKTLTLQGALRKSGLILLNWFVIESIMR